VATWETVREIGLALPMTEESTSYGQPALKVKGKLFVRLRPEGDAVSVRASFAERDALVAADPQTFSVTDHYRNYEWVLMDLEHAPDAVLETMLVESWRRAAPPKVRKALAARSGF